MDLIRLVADYRLFVSRFRSKLILNRYKLENSEYSQYWTKLFFRIIGAPLKCTDSLVLVCTKVYVPNETSWALWGSKAKKRNTKKAPSGASRFQMVDHLQKS